MLAQFTNVRNSQVNIHVAIRDAERPAITFPRRPWEREVKGHQWCGRYDVQPEEILGGPIIMRGKGSGTNDVVNAARRQHNIKTDDLIVCTTISSSGAIQQTVLAGCGLAFISEMAVREELLQGELVSINLLGLTITRTFSLVHRKGRTLSPAARVFSLVLRKVNI